MFKKQRLSPVERYVSENRIRVIINICFAFFGVICGGIVFLNSKDQGSLAQLAKEYILALKGSLGYNIFISSLKDSGIVCLVFYICSLFYVGEFLCPAYVFIRCMAHGFSGCIVAVAYGIKTGFFILLSLVPHMIFYIIALIVFSVETAKQSRFVSRGFDKKMKASAFMSYFVSSFFPVLLLLAGCLVEGFLSPHFILWCVK